jgi:Tfp pilus assembly ATPase PilU
MMVHPNSQVKGPELDSTLERLIYHRRGNFLIQRNSPKSLQYDSYIEKSQRKNLSGLKTESYIKLYRTLSFLFKLFCYY